MRHEQKPTFQRHTLRLRLERHKNSQWSKSFHLMSAQMLRVVYHHSCDGEHFEDEQYHNLEKRILYYIIL